MKVVKVIFTFITAFRICPVYGDICGP